MGRLAPSPTGRLHLGHARSFLLAWWSVRSRGGRMLLRIEDLDTGRARPELSDLVLRDLEWLGLDWDGPVLVQSADRAPYDAAVERLLAAGRAYACVCTRREVAEASAPQVGDGGEARYPSTCRGRFAGVAEAERASGRPAGVRLAVPPGSVAIADGFAGERSFDVQAEAGDFLLARRDSVVAYQLAVVVDDARQGVTEVLRGDDLLSSAARQLHLQRALDLPSPAWLHVPLVVGDDGQRLAKRRGDLALASLRAEGVDPRAVVAWAARASGLDAPGPLSARELIAGFDLARVPRAPARFGDAQLLEVRAWRA